MINPAQINASVVRRFSRLAANRRLAHAYLLVGPADCGKTQTALSLAQLVNCESETHKPCGQCAACRKIASGNHPDVHVIGNDEMDSIKIEDIRFLLGRAHLMAYEGKTKVFIIRNIERMTLDAANALLKTLEEPAANTLMILTTSVLEANLDTIKSRCHIVKFFSFHYNKIPAAACNAQIEVRTVILSGCDCAQVVHNFRFCVENVLICLWITFQGDINACRKRFCLVKSPRDNQKRACQ